MQNTPNIENTEINVNTNQQFSVLFVYNFTRNNPQITHCSCLKIQNNVSKIKKTLKMRFYEKNNKCKKRF